MPWKESTGTARVAWQSDGKRSPLTGATAAIRAESEHASSLVIRDPPENPVAYTRCASMQYVLSIPVSNRPMNATSLGEPAGAFRPPTSGTPGTFQSKPEPSGIAPCG